MLIRPKDYGRNRKKRKEYIHQSGFLLTGGGVSKAKHDACIGTITQKSGAARVFHCIYLRIIYSNFTTTCQSGIDPGCHLN